MSKRPNVPATHVVWNLTYDYCEHVGTRAECAEWIATVRRMGFTTDRFEIRGR